MTPRLRLLATVIFAGLSVTAASVKAVEPGSYVTNIGVQILLKDDMYSKVIKYLPKGTILLLQQISRNDEDMQHVTFKGGQGWIRLDESEIIKSSFDAPGTDYYGTWIEEGGQCTSDTNHLEPGTYILTQKARFHFEGKCEITNSLFKDSKWEIDEVCHATEQGKSVSKDHWTIAVSGNTAAITIIRDGNQSPAFSMHRCAQPR